MFSTCWAGENNGNANKIPQKTIHFVFIFLRLVQIKGRLKTTFSKVQYAQLYPLIRIKPGNGSTGMYYPFFHSGTGVSKTRKAQMTAIAVNYTIHYSSRGLVHRFIFLRQLFFYFFRSGFCPSFKGAPECRQVVIPQNLGYFCKGAGAAL